MSTLRSLIDSINKLSKIWRKNLRIPEEVISLIWKLKYQKRELKLTTKALQTEMFYIMMHSKSKFKTNNSRRRSLRLSKRRLNGASRKNRFSTRWHKSSKSLIKNIKVICSFKRRNKTWKIVTRNN